MTNITATVKGLRVSTRKVRLVADGIRNLKAQDALSQLRLINKHGADVLAKVIRSAMANAVNGKKLMASDLTISKLAVDEAPFLKRFHVGHRGHIRTYKKRGTHITVVLSDGSKGSEVSKEPKESKITEGVKVSNESKDAKDSNKSKVEAMRNEKEKMKKEEKKGEQK